MGKRSRKEAERLGTTRNGNSEAKRPSLWNEKAVDPTLALLFASSAGPVQAPPKSRYTEPPPLRTHAADSGSEAESNESDGLEGVDDVLSSIDEDLEGADISDLSEDEQGSEEEPPLEQLLEAAKPERKRKRKPQEEDLEGKYMQKLAKEEEKEEKEEAERQAERRLKRQRLTADQEPEEDDDVDEDMDEVSSKDSDVESEDETATVVRTAPSDIPLHESLVPDQATSELEKATRTVFLANVCTSAISSKSAKKILLTHMGSFLPSLPEPPEGKPAHKVESLRFRSTAYSTTSLPKKAAFAKKELMAATTKSTNAYVVYSTAYAAREAAKRLNGTVVLDRHLRVDGVAHPAKTDHRRCVFVGNLGFVDDESMLGQAGENERKRSKIPSDIEEGLWKQFSKAGTVESVRVIRDEKTRVGKGFAYVQFHDPDAVEAALLFNEKKYPPMLPRVLRVVRAKAIKKTALAFAASRENSKNTKTANKERIYNPKMSSEASSLQGRAGKLLGRAGAASYKKREGSGANGMPIGRRGAGGKGDNDGIVGIAKTPEKIVFEGYRASAKSGKPKDLKMGGGGGKKKSGKPRTRSTKRASDWKKGGGKSK